MIHQAKKVISYAESGDEDGGDVEFRPTETTTRGRALKRRKTVVLDNDDSSGESEIEEIDEGLSSIALPCPVSRQIKADIWVKFR